MLYVIMIMKRPTFFCFIYTTFEDFNYIAAGEGEGGWKDKEWCT